MEPLRAEVADPVKLHMRNAARLGARDVVVAGYPGSGAALIGNILIELGIAYVDPYTEAVGEDGTSQVIEDRLAYRSRLSATAASDRNAGGGEGGADDGPRFFKNHLYPDHFDHGRLAGAVLLVRDPRDAVHSSFQWFRSFAAQWPLEGVNVQGTFAEFLDGRGVNDEPPIAGWAGFYAAWTAALPRFRRSTVIRFEDLKADPEATASRLLEVFGVSRTPAAVEQAVRHSRYENMRAHEERVSAAAGAVGSQPRIMRRGMVGEWREWYGDESVAARFRTPRLLETAATFGYQLATSRTRDSR
ncbi:sulfotransferase domain-containing protein [Streptomyces sp. NPDC001922]|uniref:sulfotransferase domain-containing protein n=1 Tax=Streptomyces sp. NPDC001922 TaxID=3364624 RepID=UPI0036C7E2BE